MNQIKSKSNDPCLLSEQDHQVILEKIEERGACIDGFFFGLLVRNRYPKLMAFSREVIF